LLKRVKVERKKLLGLDSRAYKALVETQQQKKTKQGNVHITHGIMLKIPIPALCLPDIGVTR
jgi:hypothetical protein